MFVTTVSPASGRFTEPSVALDPNNSNRLVVVYQGGAEYEGSANVAYSNDGGRTFTIAKGTAPKGWLVAGDVTTTFDTKGHAFLCYLAFDHLGTANYWAHNATRNGILVLRSDDAGKTWEKNARAIKVLPAGHEPVVAFEDEPRIFADTLPQSPYAGNLYVGWVEWQLDRSIMLFSRSTDHGTTWSKPIEISTHPGLPRDGNGSLGGFVQAIAADGSIYAIWHDGNNITLAVSRDGGRTFSPSHPVIETGPPYFGQVPGVSRVEGFPQIAAGMGGNAHDLYITWSDYRNGDIDVFFSRSSDAGRMWTKATRVNTDPVHDGKDQFYQWTAVDPVSNAIYVQFYDRRDDPQNRRIGVTLARSTDGGRTFSNYRWTVNSFDAADAFIGDYTWIAAFNGHVFGVWTEAVAGQGNARLTSVIRFASADFSKTK